MNGTGKIAVEGKDFGSVEINGYSFFYIHHQCAIVLEFMNFSISSERKRERKEREQKEVIKVHCCGDLLKHQRI